MYPEPLALAAVVDALVRLCRESGFDVQDGPHVGQADTPSPVLVIGLSDGESVPGYESTSRRDGIGRTTEEFTIHCLLDAWDGNTDASALRGTVAARMQALESVLKSNPVVDGVWDKVAFGSEMSWSPIVGPEGAAILVVFTIEGSALR